MKHPAIRELFDYWTLRRGERAAPDRGDIEPGAIRRVLADTFILSFDQAAGHPFRIAGTRVCAAFGRELKNEGFLNLWKADSRPTARDLLTVVAGETVGVVASARGISTLGSTHELELLLLPLSHRDRTDVRVLGALAPRPPLHWLGAGTLGLLTLGTLRFLGQEHRQPHAVSTPPLAPLAPERPAGRIRHGLVVYDGGLT
jgi:hypothetical protein